MKKVLLGSTALLGAAMIFATPAAAEMGVSFGGFMKAEFWFADQDDEAGRPRGYNFGVDDAEFYIRAKNTADNGLSYGVNVDMELGDSINIDEGYVFFSGDDWGTIQLGGNDAPAIDMVYSGDFSLPGTGHYDSGLSAVWNFQGVANSSPDLSSDPDDSAKIIYYSPRFSGFQIGVSYAPDAAQPTTGSDSENSDDGTQEDQVTIGVNFVDTINGIDIGIGAGYLTGSTEPTGGTVLTEDSEALHVGFNIGFSGFSIGASYADQFDTGCTKTVAGCDGGEWYEVAGGYSTGPFAVGAGWFHSERDVTSSTDAETDIFSLTATYALAPGASLTAGYSHVDESGSAVTDNEGDIFMVGTVISY